MGVLFDQANSIKNRILDSMKLFDVEDKLKRIEELNVLIYEAYSKNNSNIASDLLQKQTLLKKEVENWLKLKDRILTLCDLVSEAESDNNSDMLLEFSKELNNITRSFEILELNTLLNIDVDNTNCFVNIHPGVGGTESCDWTSMLFRMYSRYFDKKGFKYEVVDFLPGEETGIKDITIYVRGELAFGYLKSETGVHRLIRISPFDASKRRHTSFAAVHVIPELGENINIDIDPMDLKIETFRASGKGGQHVNKTESAVRVSYIPAGIVVSVQNERSQAQNKEIAIKILKSKLYQIKQQELKQKIDKLSGPKKDISWGNQIRTYVLHPYTSVRDHRTNVEVTNVQEVLDGNIDIFVNSYIRWAFAKKA